MSDHSIPPWWESVEPDVVALAKKIALRYGLAVDRLALPYTPAQVETGGGTAALIDVQAMRPLWTFEVPLARHALAMRDQAAVDRVLAPQVLLQPEGTFVDDAGTDAAWRRENGLDGEATE